MKQLLLLIMLMVVCACSREDESSPEQYSGEKCLVEFTPASVGTLITRASPSYLPQGTGVKIAAYGVSGTTESADYTRVKLYNISDAAGAMTPSDLKKLELYANSTYKFYEYSPIIEFNSGSKKAVNITQGTDFMLSSLQSTLSSGLQALTMPVLDHQCCYLEFSTKLNATNVKITTLAIGDNGLNLTGITHSPACYTLGSGFNLAGLPLDGSCTIPKSSFTGASNVYTGGACVLPKVSSVSNLNMDVLLNGVRSTAVAPLPAFAFVPGNKYQFSVSFADSRIMLILTVSPWTNVVSNEDMGNGGTTIVLGSWTLATSTVDIGNGGSSISVGGWTQNPSTADMGNGGSIITIGSWTPNPAATEQLGTGGTGLSVGGWTPNSTNTNDLGI